MEQDSTTVSGQKKTFETTYMNQTDLFVTPLMLSKEHTKNINPLSPVLYRVKYNETQMKTIYDLASDPISITNLPIILFNVIPNPYFITSADILQPLLFIKFCPPFLQP